MNDFLSGIGVGAALVSMITVLVVRPFNAWLTVYLVALFIAIAAGVGSAIVDAERVRCQELRVAPVPLMPYEGGFDGFN